MIIESHLVTAQSEILTQVYVHIVHSAPNNVDNVLLCDQDISAEGLYQVRSGERCWSTDERSLQLARGGLPPSQTVLQGWIIIS